MKKLPRGFRNVNKSKIPYTPRSSVRKTNTYQTYFSRFPTAMKKLIIEFFTVLIAVGVDSGLAERVGFDDVEV